MSVRGCPSAKRETSGMWWVVWLWVAFPQVPASSAFYPPQDSILLLTSGQVNLTWKRPGRKFEVRVWRGQSLISQAVTTDRSFPVSVENGHAYSWSVKSAGVEERHSFSVAEALEYHSDGRDGVETSGRGLAGTNGGQLSVELARDEHGMNLYIQERNQARRYLFCEDGLRFLITARGGNGGRGSAGRDFSLHPQGYDGGGGGWGGNVRVKTRNAPWRDYLDLDVRPGSAGSGGPGGWYRDGDDVVQASDGEPGRPGQGGRVDTLIAEP